MYGMAVSNVSSGSFERAGSISFGDDLRDPAVNLDRADCWLQGACFGMFR